MTIRKKNNMQGKFKFGKHIDSPFFTQRIDNTLTKGIYPVSFINLSEKIWECDDGYHYPSNVLSVEDVRKFITEYIKEIEKNQIDGKITSNFVIDMLKLKAGDKLI